MKVREQFVTFYSTLVVLFSTLIVREVLSIFIPLKEQKSQIKKHIKKIMNHNHTMPFPQ